jgi:HK97 family phage major capsid protein
MSTHKAKIPAVLYRDFAIDVLDRAEPAEGEERTYPLSFSSEAPVRRWGWDGPYDEVLSHDPADVDLSRAKDGLPLLRSHWRLDHIGSVRDVELDEKRKRLRGVASFSSIPLGQEQETLLREKHLKTASVGYRVTSMEMLKKDRDGIPTYSCKWLPFEVSTEPIPADPKVGFGRGVDGDKDLVEVTIEDRTEGERAMDLTEATGTPGGTQNPPQPAQQTRTEPGAGGPPARPPEPIQRNDAEPRPPITEGRDARAEAAQIAALADAHNLGARTADWLRRGLSLDQVRGEVLESIRTKGPGQPSSEQVDQVMSRKDRSRYSIARGLRMQAEIMDGTRRSAPDGLEWEVHQELARSNPPAHGGVLIPWRTRSDEEIWQRTMGTMEATGGATLVGQMIMPDMIEILRNRALVLVAGARLYTGLQGNVIFQKETADPTVYWMDENPAAAVTGGQPTYGYVTASPKTLIGSVQVPRQLVVQSSIDIEADIRNKLGIGHGLAIDLAALHGTGAAKQPVGIYSAADVQAHAAGGVPDLADITTMPTLIASANADLGALSWMTTPGMAGVLMRTPVVSGQTLMIWTGNFREGSIFGWTARATNQMSSTLEGAAKHGLIFGNWNDDSVCMWGNALEVVVDVFTRAGYGQIVITSYSMADNVITRPASFVKATGATIV